MNTSIPIDFTVDVGGEITGPIEVPIGFDIPIEIPSYSVDLDQDIGGPAFGGGITFGGRWHWARATLDAN